MNLRFTWGWLDVAVRFGPEPSETAVAFDGGSVPVIDLDPSAPIWQPLRTGEALPWPLEDDEEGWRPGRYL